MSEAGGAVSFASLLRPRYNLKMHKSDMMRISELSICCVKSMVIIGAVVVVAW